MHISESGSTHTDKVVTVAVVIVVVDEVGSAHGGAVPHSILQTSLMKGVPMQSVASNLIQTEGSFSQGGKIAASADDVDVNININININSDDHVVVARIVTFHVIVAI